MSDLHATIQTALMGSSTAFESLISELGRKLYSIAFALAQNAEAAEDFVAAVFVHAYEQRAHIRASEDFPVWLVHQTRSKAGAGAAGRGKEGESPIHAILLDFHQQDREAFTLRHLDQLSHGIIDARLALEEGGSHKVRREVFHALRESREKSDGSKLEAMPTHIESWILGKLDRDISANDSDELDAYLSAHPEARLWMEREKGLFEAVSAAFEAARPNEQFEERVIAKFRAATAKKPQDFLLLRSALDGFWSRILLVAIPAVMMFFVGVLVSTMMVTSGGEIWKAPPGEEERMLEKIAQMHVQSYRSAHISLRVDGSTRETIQAIQSRAAVMHGWVQSETLEPPKGTGTLVVRVPGISLDGLLAEISTLGKVKIRTLQTSDPSSELKDIGKSFLIGLETEKRLVELLQAKKSSLEETLKIEAELRRLRQELDRIRTEVGAAESRALNPEIRISIEGPPF